MAKYAEWTRLLFINDYDQACHKVVPLQINVCIEILRYHLCHADENRVHRYIIYIYIHFHTIHWTS